MDCINGYWINGFMVLLGALVGGACSLLGTCIAAKKQMEKEILFRKANLLEKVNKELYYPLLDHTLWLKSKQDVNELDKLLTTLRRNRYYFFLSKELTDELSNLYFTLEKEKTQKESWDHKDIETTLNKLGSIQKKIYHISSSVGSVLDIK